MTTFRPKATDFQTAMRQIQLFDNFLEMDDYPIDYHNLRIITRQEQVWLNYVDANKIPLYQEEQHVCLLCRAIFLLGEYCIDYNY